VNNTLSEVASIAAVVNRGRFDMYSAIHKAIRLMLANAMVAAGQLDTDDDEAITRLGGQVQQLADHCQRHLEHENAFVHTAIEARAPGMSGRIAGEHEQHESDIRTLRHYLRALVSAPHGERAPAAAALYHALALFTAHNLEHMYIEETEHNRLLWQHYSDAEIAGIHARLLAHIPPPESQMTMRFMLPAMAPAERLATLRGMKAAAPAFVFDGMLGLAKSVLPAPEWQKLDAGLSQKDA
jgi:iron-sulfur cluster repair protein YtfE (RIC family)